VDRQGIKTFLSNIIKDELQTNFMVCNIEGYLHDIRWGEQWEQDLGSGYESDTEIPPLLKINEEEDDDSSIEEIRGFRSEDEYDSDHDEPRNIKILATTRSGGRKTQTPPKESGRKSARRKTKKETHKKEEHTTVDEDEDDELYSNKEDDETPPHLETNNRAKTALNILEDTLEPNKETGERIAGISPRITTPSKKNIEDLSRYFPGTNIDTIWKTMDATTQYGSKGAIDGHTLHNQIKSPNPILNIPRRHEEVATDTMYSNTPAVDSGSTAAQFFIGRKSHFRSARKLGSSDKDFVHTLMDEIRKYGAMDKLVSDNAKAQISARVKDVLRTFANR